MPRISIMPSSARISECLPKLDRPMGAFLCRVIVLLGNRLRLTLGHILLSDAKLDDFLKDYDPLP